jgi:hypothetical protein
MTNMTLIEKIKGASTLERQQLAAAISAASEQMDVEQKRALVKSLTEAVHASDAKHSREERRISRIEAASKNPAMEVPFKTALRSLRRLGLDIDKIAAAGDCKELDRALSEQQWGVDQRWQLKAILKSIGVLD